MTPETVLYLEKSRQTLERARVMLGVDLTEDAGRAAYLVAFHAAEALICERTGTAPKTHSGALSAFAWFAMSEPMIGEELRKFLPRSYDFKTVCDYGLGPDAVIPKDKAAQAVDTAAQFLKYIEPYFSGN